MSEDISKEALSGLISFIDRISVESDIEAKFIDAIYEFVEEHKDLHLNEYAKILEKNNLKWDESIKNADTNNLDTICILAMILSIVRADRFYGGVLKRYINEGVISKWLVALKEKGE